ncbi:hypothetical protein AB0O07_26455 [Streptomyces sp. NPDC093085]|uniref:hypothetical protein n=1 Tax=Streptomyces sp. NPDC093085 TaxID=3155068 RepID=UPI0034304475
MQGDQNEADQMGVEGDRREVDQRDSGRGGGPRPDKDELLLALVIAAAVEVLSALVTKLVDCVL